MIEYPLPRVQSQSCPRLTGPDRQTDRQTGELDTSDRLSNDANGCVSESDRQITSQSRTLLAIIWQGKIKISHLYIYTVYKYFMYIDTGQLVAIY